jgi:hypothetical protein
MQCTSSLQSVESGQSDVPADVRAAAAFFVDLTDPTSAFLAARAVAIDRWPNTSGSSGSTVSGAGAAMEGFLSEEALLWLVQAALTSELSWRIAAAFLCGALLPSLANLSRNGAQRSCLF